MSVFVQPFVCKSSFLLFTQDEAAVHKTYIARVLGAFPTSPQTVDHHLAWDSRANHAFLIEANGMLSDKQSMGRVPEPSQSQGLQAKAAQTDVRLLSIAADGKTSLVECRPKTGRTHQIRYLLALELSCITGQGVLGA